MKRTYRGLLALVLTAALAGQAVAQGKGSTHYRWQDARGNPVFSDRPPPEGVDYQVESTRSTFVRKVEADEGAVPLATTPTVGNEFKQSDKKKQEPAKNPVACEKARKNLDTLDNSPRVRLRGEDGEYRYIDEAERDELRVSARQIIARHCE